MIQRYRYDEGDGNWRFPGHVQDTKGEYVKYEDHRALLDKANAAIKEAYQNGKAVGFNEGYNEGVIDERGSAH
jgi:flagellar biosynthesis/type III secretory pathway protein FliH